MKEVHCKPEDLPKGVQATMAVVITSAVEDRITLSFDGEFSGVIYHLKRPARSGAHWVIERYNMRPVVLEAL